MIVQQLTSPMLCEVIRKAQSEIGVQEDPPGSNRGMRVGEYLRSVRLNPGYPWCAAFVYWCFEEVTGELEELNPLIRTGACMQHWKKSTGIKILSAYVVKNPLLIEVGDIFIINLGGGKGHTGIVTGVGAGVGSGIIDGYIQTIEGNTNASFSSAGGAVCELRRKISSINVGFIRYNN